MKDNKKPPEKMDFGDTKAVTVPRISTQTSAGTNGNNRNNTEMLGASGTNTIPNMGSGASNFSIAQTRLRLRQLLAALLHAVQCQVRDELIGNTGEGATSCPTPHCQTMKTALNHSKNCNVGLTCFFTHCTSSMLLLAHWKLCTNASCPICRPLRRVVPQYLETLMRDSQCRQEILSRFSWLIALIRPNITEIQIAVADQSQNQAAESNEGNGQEGPTNSEE